MTDTFEASDTGAYKRYTFPQEVDKAVHMLEGIVRGITIDGVVGPEEITFLRSWCDCYRAASARHPFGELIPLLESSIQDGVLDGEERADLLWFCERFSTQNAYFNVATSDMQRLQGLLIGISADNVITPQELAGLSRWLEEHDHLKSTWPYDEIDSLVTGIVDREKLDEAEEKFLLHFCREFVGHSPALLLEPEFDESLIRHGVCATCPEIVFADRLFCFTGKSAKPKSELADVVHRMGGRATPSMTKAVSYLVVGGAGNTSWAFSCYGRKVEQAVRLRREGLKIVIAHEFDFWDAVRDQA